MQSTLYILTLLYFCSFFKIQAQLMPEKIGARSLALGNATVAFTHDQSFFGNPAAMQGTLAQATWSAPQFAPELGTSALHIQHQNMQNLIVAVGAERFGDRYYNQSKLSAALAKKIERVQLGVKASWFTANVFEVSGVGTFLAEFGVKAQLNSKLNIGLHGYNLLGAKLFDEQNIPTVIRGGLQWLPTDKINILTELEGIPSQGVWPKFGLEYRPKQPLSIRTGLQTATQNLSFGLGYKPKKIGFDYALSTHPSLGIFHHISLSMHEIF